MSALALLLPLAWLRPAWAHGAYLDISKPTWLPMMLLSTCCKVFVACLPEQPHIPAQRVVAWMPLLACLTDVI